MNRKVIASVKSALRQFPLLVLLARWPYERQRYRLARKYLHGTGIEIGALHRPLKLPPQAKAYYLDRLEPEQLKTHYPELGNSRIYVSLVGEGENLGCIRDRSLDFLVANHFIEHCEDPLATLKEFTGKLRPGGIIFMAVPERRRTFERRREETSWEHLLLDHERGPETSRLGHFQEWASKVYGLKGDHIERGVTDLQAMNYSIHYHCWSKEGFINFLQKLSAFLPLELVDLRSWRQENIFILRKAGAG